MTLLRDIRQLWHSAKTAHTLVFGSENDRRGVAQRVVLASWCDGHQYHELYQLGKNPKVEHYIERRHPSCIAKERK